MGAKKHIKTLTIGILALCLVTIVCKNTFADSGSSSTSQGGAITGGKACKGHPDWVCYSTGWGGSWVKYPVKDNSEIDTTISHTDNGINITVKDTKIGNSSTFNGGTLLSCPKETTHYFRLAPSYFVDEGKTYVGQAGLMTVAEFTSEGYAYNSSHARPDKVKTVNLNSYYDVYIGGSRYTGTAHTAGKSVDEAIATQAFLAAARADNDGNNKTINGLSYDGTSAFCYSEDYENKSGNGEFYSTSTVTISNSDITGDDGKGKTVTTEKDGNAEIKFSTDKDKVTVNFSHVLYYDHKDFQMNASDTGTVATNWEVTTDIYKSKDKSNIWDNNLKPNSDHNDNVWKEDITIDLGLDDEKQVCSTINYKQKYAELTGKLTDGHFDYVAKYRDNKSSSVCVTVTRPGTPKGGPKNTGGVSSDVMFVGEDVQLRWEIEEIKGYETRRIGNWGAVEFQINNTVDFNNFKSQAFTAPTETSTQEDFDKYCEKLYISHFGVTNNLCKTYEVGNYGSSTTSVNYIISSDPLMVSDNLGDKYCHSFSYRSEYWYGIRYKKDGSYEWKHDDQKDYWYTFQPACRTIAKKPSAAVWNGSIMTTGNIITSLAPRHDSFSFGGEANSTTRTLYGSWTEYLTIANQDLDANRTMSSGSAISEGSKPEIGLSLCSTVTSPWKTNSPLTISNLNPGAFGGKTDSGYVCQLKASGISNSSTFLTRLNAYFNEEAESHKNNFAQFSSIDDLPGGNIKQSSVVTTQGDLTISRDIIIDNSQPYDMNSLPQVIIFVQGGDLHIAENVTRLDAWIIITQDQNGSGGTLNTCSVIIDDGSKDFTPGDSQFSNVSGAISASETPPCSKQLVINGPVVAHSVKLQRTYGAEAIATGITGVFDSANSKQAPAEIFNLRADSYLWAYAQSTRQSLSYNATYSRELAPRY